MGLSFTIAAGSRQRCHSQVNFTVSDSRFPQSGGPGPCIYIPQEQGDPVITQALGSFLLPPTCRATVEVFDPASTWDYE
jgi:hypothetical protein